MRLVSDLISTEVVVRSSGSGVWIGKLVDAENASVKLENARRAWSWQGAGSCSALASFGPEGGKICAPVESVVIHGVCEILQTTEAARAAWAAVPEWTGRGE